MKYTKDNRKSILDHVRPLKCEISDILDSLEDHILSGNAQKDTPDAIETPERSLFIIRYKFTMDHIDESQHDARIMFAHENEFLVPIEYRNQRDWVKEELV